VIKPNIASTDFKSYSREGLPRWSYKVSQKYKITKTTTCEQVSWS